MMICQNCKNNIPDNASFCPECGAQVMPQQSIQQPAQPVYQAPGYAANGAMGQGVLQPGFSDRVNAPEILAAVKKNRKAAGIFAFFLVPLPLIGFYIYGLVSDEMETSQALLIGAVVSAIFLAFALYGFISQRANNSYEAVVTDKRTEIISRNEGDARRRIIQYVTVVKTTDGKTKKIREQEGSQIWAYNYLNVGDRFRYHPQFAFPYEHYDKSRAPYIACVSCGTKNPVEADRCSRCNLPLLK